MTVKSKQTDAYRMTAEEVVAELGSDPRHGLRGQDASARLRQYGPNELETEKPEPAWRRFLAQFQDVLIILLLVATAISLGLWVYERDSALPYEGMTIFAIVLLNGILGYVQETRAEQAVAKDDLEPKAISCYELYLPEIDQTWLRFVDGRPVSSITTQFLQWSCEKLQAAGKKVLLLIWDNASWHISKEVRRWLGQHNRRVKNSGCGVRIISCLLPKQSPWLNAIEPKWVHGKRKVVEPEGLLGAYELADRVCRVFDCPHYEHLSIPENAV
jgi:Cation transporter/ATPase, N-terminus/DDE superfamily endonuclease